MPYSFAAFYLIPIANITVVPYLMSVAEKTDMFLGYGVNDVTSTSDHLSELAFHELTHASHYNKVGSAWWNSFVNAEVNEIIAHPNANDPLSPYGNGGTTNSPIIALGESWAYHIGHYFASLKYGVQSGQFKEQGEWYFNGWPDANLNSNLNLLEDFDSNRIVNVGLFGLITQGLDAGNYSTCYSLGLPG